MILYLRSSDHLDITIIETYIKTKRTILFDTIDNHIINTNNDGEIKNMNNMIKHIKTFNEKNELVILNSDKGIGPVVMYKKDYRDLLLVVRYVLIPYVHRHLNTLRSLIMISSMII
jgi:hypothetical protein